MKKQRGGTILGFILGLVVGLGIALGVAVYITKVPLPFMNKGQTRSADQNDAETKKNKDWDPNAPEAKIEDKPAQPSADPLGALAKSKAGASEPPQISFFVQVGAFRTAEDAQGQRAKLALNGVDAKVTEREQGGRPLFRVRVGPFERLEDAERSKEKLDKAGIETALVKVQR